MYPKKTVINISTEPYFFILRVIFTISWDYPPSNVKKWGIFPAILSSRKGRSNDLFID